MSGGLRLMINFIKNQNEIIEKFIGALVKVIIPDFNVLKEEILLLLDLVLNEINIEISLQLLYFFVETYNDKHHKCVLDENSIILMRKLVFISRFYIKCIFYIIISKFSENCR